MSISSARHFIERSGCGWITGGVIALVLVIGLFAGNCRGGNRDEEQKQPKIAIATSGKIVASLQELERLAESNIQASGKDGLIDPAMAGQIYADVALSLVNKILVETIADERKLSVSDDELRTFNKSQTEASLIQIRSQFIQNKLLKPDASEADFAAMYEKQSGRSISDIKKQIETEFNATLADPEKRADLAFSALARKLTESYSAKITVTDEELKKGYLTYTTKRVIANSFRQEGTSFKTVPKADLDAKMAAVQAALKSGMSFEAAMEKYSDDPKPSSTKSKGESTLDFQQSILTYDKALTPIMKLKVGEISGVLQTSSGPAIFKLYKIQDKVPADFEKTKDSVRKGRIAELANKAASEDLRKRIGTVKFSSPVVKELVAWRVSASDPEVTGDRAGWLEFLKRTYTALKSATDTVLGERITALATYAAFREYYNSVAPTQQKELRGELLELMLPALEASPHIESYHELSKLALEEKNYEVSADALRGAMEITVGSSDASVSNHKVQRALIDRLKASGSASKIDIEDLEGQYERWSSDLTDELKLAAESNGDYTAAGEVEYKSQLNKLQRFEGLGYLKPNQVAEIREQIEKWKAGVFEGIKSLIEFNEDYSEVGQAGFSNMNAQIERFASAGYLTASQRGELMKIQNKWKEGKKKFDAEEAANKAAAKSNAAPAPAKPTAGSKDLLNPGPTGN